jgi:sulfur-oxidizing protein SoxY
MHRAEPSRRGSLRALAAAGSLLLLPRLTQAQAVAAAADAGLSPPNPQLSLRQMTAPLLGGAPLRQQGITLDLPALADNGHVVPLRVTVASPMTAVDHVTHIWLLSPRNPVTRMAVFHLGPWSARAEVATRVRLAGTQAVVALARLSSGEFLYAQTEVVVTESACLDAG